MSESNTIQSIDNFSNIQHTSKIQDKNGRIVVQHPQQGESHHILEEDVNTQSPSDDDVINPPLYDPNLRTPRIAGGKPRTGRGI